MTGFSKYLQSFMKANKISIVELSREVEIDRTILYRYIKGARIPSNIDTVIKIANVIKMPEDEKEYLLDEYDKLLLGEPVVYSYRYVNKLILGLSKRIHSVNRHKCRIRSAKRNLPVVELNSKEEIIAYTLDLFRNFADGQGFLDKICCVMQPFYCEMQKLILQTLMNSTAVVEQIVCLEQNINRGYENLRIFEEILPLCYALPKYEVYYYYDLIDSHINMMSYMPNLIIAGDRIIQFDYKMNYGMAIKEDTYVKAIYKQYELLQRETRNLVRGRNTLKFLPKFAADKELDIYSGAGKTVSRQLCIDACLDREMLANHISPAVEKEEVIEGILRKYGDWNGEICLNFGKRSSVISYGNLKGMEEFLDTGKVSGVLDDLYSPLLPDERRIVLQRMIILMKQGWMSYRFIADKVEFPKEIRLSCFEHQKVVEINCLMGSKTLRVMAGELSIYRTFSLYLEYLEKKNLIYSESETLGYLEKMLDNLTLDASLENLS